MEEVEARRAVAAARSAAEALGLAVEDAVVLSDSNRLVVRLLPCDTVARVAPLSHFADAGLEVEVAAGLARTGGPIAPLDRRVPPRVHQRDGFEVALWQHVERVDRQPARREYADALVRLHTCLRELEVATPHVIDRIEAATRDAADVDVTPDLADDDRGLLTDVLRDLGRSVVERGAPEQRLHGEPHAGNVLLSVDGLLFVDFENAARGPVEYDLAWVPGAVADRYPGIDGALLDDCRGLVLAIIAMHRWQRHDRHPSGRESGVAFLDAVRAGPPFPPIDQVTW